MSSIAGPVMAYAQRGEFARGWPTLLLALCGVAASVGALQIYSLGSLIVPLEKAHGWSRADLQLVVSFLAAGAAISVNFAGSLNARYGMRAVSALSLLALALAFGALTSVQGSIAWLYAAYFVLPFIGLGTTPVTWTHIVAMRFERHRGLALSLVLCGTGVTAAALPPLLAWVIGRWGWQAGFATLALPPLLLWASMAWRQMPSRSTAVASSVTPAGEGVAFREALKSRRFWTCNLGLGLVVSAIYGLATNIVPLLRDIGVSAQVAGSVFSVFGLSLVAGRLLVGALVDRFWAPGVAAIALALPAAGCALFLMADASSPLAVLVMATALCGVGSGAEFDIAAYLVSRYFGLRDYGRLFGVHLGFVTIGSAVAPFGFAALMRSTGSNHAMLLLCASACVVGPLLLLTLGRYPSRQR